MEYQPIKFYTRSFAVAVTLDELLYHLCRSNNKRDRWLREKIGVKKSDLITAIGKLHGMIDGICLQYEADNPGTVNGPPVFDRGDSLAEAAKLLRW